MQTKTKFPRALKRALAACAAALCLAAFLASPALAAEPQRTPMPLDKTLSITLRTPPVAAHGPTYSFTVPETGFYQLKLSDVLLKEGGSFTIQALSPKGEVLASNAWGNFYDWDWEFARGGSGGNDGGLSFAAKKGGTVILDLIPYLDAYDDEGSCVNPAPNSLVATFKMELGRMAAKPLAENEAAVVKLTGKAPAALYSFTPARDGYYSFASSECADSDPCAELYDSGGKQLGANDDAWIGLALRDERGKLEPVGDFLLDTGMNFNISKPLKAGETYYLLAKELGGNPCAYDLTVVPSALAFAGGTMNVGFHKSAWFSDLIGACTYDTLVLSTDFTLGWMGNAVEGYSRGTQTITFASPDGKYTQDVTFKVDYDFAQWFALIFCGGWLWLDQTPVLAPGQTLLEYWADQIRWQLYELQWQVEYRMRNVLDILDPLGWFHDSYSYYDDFMW